MNSNITSPLPVIAVKNIEAIAIGRVKLSEAVDELIDLAGESWFDLGERLERQRWIDLLDKLENSLVDSEEDAKMTIHIIRKLAGIEEE